MRNLLDLIVISITGVVTLAAAFLFAAIRSA
jgi:hypothetical protein